MLIESERDQSIIEHILRYCEQVCNYIDRFGKDFEIFSPFYLLCCWIVTPTS